MTLHELHAKARQFGRGYFAEHGCMPPTVLALAADRRLHVLVMPGYIEARERYQHLLAAYFAHHGVCAYAHASETWLVEASAAEPAPTPSRDPRRVEALLTGAVDKDAVAAHTYRIIRQDDRPPRVGELMHDLVATGYVIARVGLFGLLDVVPGLGTDPIDRAACKIAAHVAVASRMFAEVEVLEPSQYVRKYND